MYSDIYIFNPTCEMAVANGTVSYMPPKILQKFEKDLEVIPSYFAKENDFVIVKEPVDNSWISYMKEMGFKLPKYILKENLSENKELLNSNLGVIRPWGWSPVIHNLFKRIKPFFSEDFKKTPNFLWKDIHKNLYSRKMALGLYDYISDNYEYDFLAGKDGAPSICKSIEEVGKIAEKYNRIVVKAPWSSSGRGLLIVRENYLSVPESQWISGILKHQKYIMAEEWRDKLFDISFHFFIDENSKVNYIGNASFYTDDKGSYEGNYLRALPKNLNKDIRDFLNEGKIEILSDILKDALEKSLLPNNYYGYLGIDAYVFQTNNGFKIFPCVEINLRYNMGTLNLKIRELVADYSEGVIVTTRVNDCSMTEFVDKMKERYPLEMKSGKLSKGFIPLVPTNNRNVFINYLLLE